MGVPDLLLVGVVLLLGLTGVLVPGVPGAWLVWAAVAWWALQEPRGVAWGLLGGATVLLLAAQAVRWQLPSRRLRDGALDRRLSVSAGLGTLVGFCVPPLVGAPFGFMGGIYVAERLRLGGHGQAVAAVRAAMRAGGWGVFAELFSCLLVAAAWLGVVIAG
ncbi:DUF456 domain-containing protein [Streptomyces sp. NPDC050560]|uniref:DUF456 domain-containing protein n=1 Tax=Streptomyces sp. NPDC050560 TaxID=3365630 RepID=UPI0037ACBD54